MPEEDSTEGNIPAGSGFSVRDLFVKLGELQETSGGRYRAVSLERLQAIFSGSMDPPAEELRTFADLCGIAAYDPKTGLAGLEKAIQAAYDQIFDYRYR